MSSQLFASPSEIDGQCGGMETLAFGQTNGNHRYKMPLLPGEQGAKRLPKGVKPWVPGGMQSATNLAGSISETRALGIWERERTQLGLALSAPLAERLAFVVNRAVHHGLDLRQKLKDSPAGLALKDELALIHEEARQACYANDAARQGTNRHDVWEAYGSTGQLFGTAEINGQLTALSQLLARVGLERVPGMSERVIRNTTLDCAGRFDDWLRTTRPFTWPDGMIPAGTLLMADLKTKRRAFWAWLEPRIQLTVYATAEWLLEGEEYVPGPKYHVSQQWGVLLHSPADGAPPVLKRVNLVKGMAYAKLARAVCDARSESKSVAAHAEAEWA